MASGQQDNATLVPSSVGHWPSTYHSLCLTASKDSAPRWPSSKPSWESWILWILPRGRSLEEVAAEISGVLKRSDPELKKLRLEPPHNMTEQLSENVESFRVQHPTLAGILQRLVDGLAEFGNLSVNPNPI